MATTRRKTKRANRDLVRLFHPTWTRVDPATCRVVERGEVATWWIDYRENGRRIRQNLRTENRTDAERLAGEVRERLRRAAVGLAPTKVDGVRALPFWRHVRGFLGTLRARGAVGQYRDDVRLCLYKALRATHPRPWRPGATPDLDVGPVAAYLVEIQRRGLGARSVNRRVGALRAFGRWLVENRRTPFNPYAGLRPVNVETDRRRVRRSLSADEVARLLEAARTRPLAEARATAAAEAARRAAGAPPRRTAAEVTEAAAARLRAAGEGRALVYALAVGTGLRRGELARLRWQDLELGDREAGEVRIPAASAKSRRDQRVPLRGDLVDALAAERARRAAEPASAPAVAPYLPSVETFGRDLIAAGIVPPRRDAHGDLERDRWGRLVADATDDEGRTVDFHALRTTFVSLLAASGVHPRVAQALARHSTVELTMRAYTDLSALNLRGAVEGLPAAGCLPSACLYRAEPGPSEASQGPIPGGAERADRSKPRRKESRATGTSGAVCGVARPEGLEPPTPRSEVWCSIQLS